MMPGQQPNPGNIQYQVIGKDGREYGPVALEGLQAWIQQGQLNAQSQVRRGNETRWQPAMELPELQSLLGTSSGPPVISPAGQMGVMPVQPQVPEDPAKEALARKLVIASHILGYGGLLVLIGGPIIAGAVLDSGTLAAVAAVGGILMAIIGAIIGQVGRGMQGRAI